MVSWSYLYDNLLRLKKLSCITLVSHKEEQQTRTRDDACQNCPQPELPPRTNKFLIVVCVKNYIKCSNYLTRRPATFVVEPVSVPLGPLFTLGSAIIYLQIEFVK